MVELALWPWKSESSDTGLPQREGLSNQSELAHVLPKGVPA